MKFLARDLVATGGGGGGSGGGGVKSSSKGDANDSLFGGHQVGLYKLNAADP